MAREGQEKEVSRVDCGLVDSRCGTRDTLLASTFVILAPPTCRRVIDRFAAVIESRHSKDVNPVKLVLRKREEYRRGRGGGGRGEWGRKEEEEVREYYCT